MKKEPIGLYYLFGYTIYMENKGKKTFFIVRTMSELDSSSSDALYLDKYLCFKYNIKHICPKESMSLKNSVVLFIDRHHFLSVFEKLDNSNKIIATWWHGWKGTLVNVNKNPFVRFCSRFKIPFQAASSWRTLNDHLPLLEKLNRALPGLNKLICSCDEVINRLVQFHNIPREKIVKIPIGVDLETFKPASSEQERQAIKKKLGIPLDKFVIGNFSRDTRMDGSPKWVKDPEAFLKVIRNVHRENRQVFVLLTNRRRGFVKHHLKKLGIPFLHLKEKQHAKMTDIYKATDLSLITSREEGGPNQLYESWASGVAVVSTAQGMALDWLIDNKNGLMCPIEDIACLTEKTKQVIENAALQETLIKNGFETAKELDWKKISQKYDELIFSKIL